MIHDLANAIPHGQLGLFIGCVAFMSGIAMVVLSVIAGRSK